MQACVKQQVYKQVLRLRDSQLRIAPLRMTGSGWEENGRARRDTPVENASKVSPSKRGDG